MKSVGIVILNYNDVDTTLTLLNQIYKFDEISKIVVVDNNSTDQSYEILYQQKSKYGYYLIQSSKNGGYSYGNNLGIKQLLTDSNLDIVIIANPDVLFDNKTICRIKTEFSLHPEIGLISPIMKDSSGKEMRMWLKLPSYLNSLLDCSFIGRQVNKLLGRVSIDYSYPLFEVEKIPGSFMAFRVSMLKEIGLFDENVFLYYEENIIGYKMKHKGFKTALITDMSYIHNHSVTISKNISVLNSYRNNLKSKLYYELKYRKIGMFRCILLKIFMRYGLAEKAFLLRFRNK